MFKDPFSPDHTQKLEDAWLRYFKKNCKNPKMVSQVFGSAYYTIQMKGRYSKTPGEKSEFGKTGDSPCGGETK